MCFLGGFLASAPTLLFLWGSRSVFVEHSVFCGALPHAPQGTNGPLTPYRREDPWRSHQHPHRLKQREHGIFGNDADRSIQAIRTIRAIQTVRAIRTLRGIRINRAIRHIEASESTELSDTSESTELSDTSEPTELSDTSESTELSEASQYNKAAKDRCNTTRLLLLVIRLF